MKEQKLWRSSRVSAVTHNSDEEENTSNDNEENTSNNFKLGNSLVQH